MGEVSEKRVRVRDDGHSYWVRNPADTVHPWIVLPYDKWEFNGDFVKPTFSPSVLVYGNEKTGRPRTHCFIRDGRIEYLSDCTHELAGMTRDVRPITDDAWETRFDFHWKDGTA